MSTIPDGYYTAVATQVDTLEGPIYTQFMTKDDGTRQVAVVFEITEGEFKGRKLTWFGSFKSDKSAEIAIKALRVMGFTGDNLDTIFDQQLDNVVSLTVATEEWEGKSSLKVKWVNSPGGGGFKAKGLMTQTEMKQLAVRYKKTVVKTPTVQGIKKGTAVGGQAVDDGDPF